MNLYCKAIMLNIEVVVSIEMETTKYVRHLSSLVIRQIIRIVKFI